MTIIKRTVSVVVLALCSVAALYMFTGSLVEQVEHSGRALAARSLAEAHNYLHDQATSLVAEAAGMARQNELPAAQKDERALRWMLDVDGRLSDGYGAGFEAQKPSLVGMNVVARALAGVASDGIVVLATGDKERWWHLAASPINDAGSVGGVAVTGRPMDDLARGLSDQMAALSASSSLPVSVALVTDGDVLAGRVSGGVKDVLRPGKMDGLVKGVGEAELGPGLAGGALQLVAGDLIVTEGGRLILATIVETRKAYDAVAETVKTGLALLLFGSLLGFAVLVVQMRRQERAGEVLIDWLHTWRASGAGAPVESLNLPALLERVARNVDLTLAGQHSEAVPTFSAQVELSSEDEDDVFADDDDAAADFEQFSASAVFDAARHDVSNASAGSANLFDGLSDTDTKLGELPPIPGVSGGGPSGLPDLPAVPGQPQISGGGSALPELPPVPGAGPALPPVPGGGSALPPSPLDLAAKEVAEGAAIGPGENDHFEDAPTGQFDVPNDLLERISGAATPVEEPADPLQLLFDKYVATRQRLGQRTEGLTLERFRIKIDTSRAQIMEKSGAKDVNFTVREKDGKASLRAQPVMD